jgi:hypothetical protein
MEKGKQLFGAKLTAPGCIHGRKMVRKYRKGHRGQLRCSLGQQLDNNIIFCMRWDLTPDRSLIVLSSYAPLKLTLNMSFFYIDYLAIWVNHIDRAQHIYPTLEQDTEDCPELRYFASHSILSVGTNSPHFDTCIPSWIATSSDSRFSRIIGQYWWKNSHKQTQIRRWEIAECVSPSISFERSIALCWKILPRKGPVCVSCYNKQAVTGQLLIREMQGDRALWCYSVQRSHASESKASTGHGCVPANMF